MNNNTNTCFIPPFLFANAQGRDLRRQLGSKMRQAPGIKKKSLSFPCASRMRQPYYWCIIHELSLCNHSLIRLLSHIMPLSTNGLSRLCPNPKCCSPEKRTYILKYLLTMQCPYYHLEITGSSNKFFFTSFIKNTPLMPKQKRDMVSVNCLK